MIQVSRYCSPNGEKSIIKDVDGIKIGFVSYNQFNGAPLEQQNTIDEIKKVKTATDLVIIFCHWGDEYQLKENTNQETLAHQFVDAGADLVIGSHPHVIQPMEEYMGKRIYYSLGNFIFDQYFNESVRNGLGVVVQIDKTTKKLDFSERHFYLQNNGQTLLTNGQAVEEITEK